MHHATGWTFARFCKGKHFLGRLLAPTWSIFDLRLLFRGALLGLGHGYAGRDTVAGCGGGGGGQVVPTILRLARSIGKASLCFFVHLSGIWMSASATYVFLLRSSNS